MKNECPRCAMSVEPGQAKCAFCDATLPGAAKIATSKIEGKTGAKPASAGEVGCMALVAVFFVLFELSLLTGALRNDADANISRIWALVFAFPTFALVRSLWKKFR